MKDNYMHGVADHKTWWILNPGGNLTGPHTQDRTCRGCSWIRR